jgi:hypothetical protein
VWCSSLRPAAGSAIQTDFCRPSGHWDEYQEAFNMLLTRCSTPVAPWYIVPADDKPFRDWAVSRLLLETLRAINPRVPMPKLNVPSLVQQLPPVD